MATKKKRKSEIRDPQRLARLITKVQQSPDSLSDLLTDKDLSISRAHVVGITGSTAAGKSTLIDKIIGVLREDNFTVVVLAIDPTEEESGGAILGDTIRMRDYYLDEGVFLRSFGSRGAASAVTVYLAQVVELVSHFADFIVVETAGAGQADTALKQCVDTFITLPDTRGDAINLLKAGHHRRAHILVVNARSGILDDERFFSLAKEFVKTAPLKDGWESSVFKVNASTGEGMAELVSKGIYAHRDFLGSPSSDRGRSSADRGSPSTEATSDRGG